MRRTILLLVAATLASPAPGRQPAHPRVGQCFSTRVAKIDGRLENDPASGSAILYANGLSQVSYELVPGIRHSRPGDPIHLCITALPHDCPPGDRRGIVYKAVNLRTHESWREPDSEHGCGGG